MWRNCLTIYFLFLWSNQFGRMKQLIRLLNPLSSQMKCGRILHFKIVQCFLFNNMFMPVLHFWYATYTEQGRKSRTWWLGITCCSVQTEAASSFLNQDALTFVWRRQETWSSGCNLKKTNNIYAFARLDSRLGVKMIVLFALGEWRQLTDHSDVNEQLLTQIQFVLVHFFKTV